MLNYQLITKKKWINFIPDSDPLQYSFVLPGFVNLPSE